ncbi:IclR family transcriptional regulator [Ramlibacter sp.]|uniref:IclR family transcriptional regulator n=1 Tax=Ramlibacter sp. TaxID=1917967 RepID=UPI003D1459B0
MADVRMVLRAPQGMASAPDTNGRGELIAPIERGLGILAAFREGDEWLGNREIAERTGIPKATVTRLAQTLAAEGFLNHSSRLRKYRLAARVLGLGYASTHSFDLAATARPLLQEFADQCGVFAALASRDGLESTIVELSHSSTTLMTLAVGHGAQFPLEGTPLGLALLAGLPDNESEYLLERIRLRHPADHRLALRQRIADAKSQVRQRGYCACAGDLNAELVVAAAPLSMREHPAFVIACAAPASSLTRARLVEFVGPRLTALAERLRSMEAAHD